MSTLTWRYFWSSILDLNVKIFWNFPKFQDGCQQCIIHNSALCNAWPHSCWTLWLCSASQLLNPRVKGPLLTGCLASTLKLHVHNITNELMKSNKSHDKGSNGDLFSNKYFFKIILSHAVTHETFPSWIFTTCRSEVLACFKYDKLVNKNCVKNDRNSNINAYPVEDAI